MLNTGLLENNLQNNICLEKTLFLREVYIIAIDHKTIQKDLAKN